MAKVVQKEPTQPRVHHKVDTPVLKPGGKSYKVLESYLIGERGNTVPAGFVLKEYTDGTYQLYNLDGDKHFFRIGQELVDKLKKKEL